MSLRLLKLGVSLLVALHAAGALGAAADNDIFWSGVHSSKWDRNPIYPGMNQSWTAEVRVYRNDLTAANLVVLNPAGTASTYAMTWNRNETIKGTQYDWFRATVPGRTDSYLRYYFQLVDGTKDDFFSATGMSADAPTGAACFAIDLNTDGTYDLGATRLGNGTTVFRVWAPNATAVTVPGTWNGFSTTAFPLTKHYDYWEGSSNLPAIGHQYKFYLTDSGGNHYKQDPRSRAVVSSTGNSIIRAPSTYVWGDSGFVRPALLDTIQYELHVGTFAGLNDGVPNAPAKFRNVVDAHIADLLDLGINCVEVLPCFEYATDWSRGYNPAQIYAPESAYGNPDDLKYMIDKFHQAGIAVIFDVVFNHLGPSDLDLWNYDNTQLYFYTDARKSTPWGDTRPDYTKREVLDFLLSNLRYWQTEFHVDGFRFDGTDYIKRQGAGPEGWSFMRQASNIVRAGSPNAYVIAEQLPNDNFVTKDYSNGGAGFDAQWHDAMHDNLKAAIVSAAFGDPNMASVASAIRADGFDSPGNVINMIENHDEVSNGNSRLVVDIDSGNHHSIYAKDRSKVAAGIILTAPGVPMIFQGQEMMEDKYFESAAANRIDWSFKTTYANVRKSYKDLIALRKGSAAMRSTNVNVHHVDEGNNIIAFERWSGSEHLIVVASLSNTDFTNYQVGFPSGGVWKVLYDSDSVGFDGNGLGNGSQVTANGAAYDGMGNSALLVVPKRSIQVFQVGGPAAGVENFELY